ncbi:sperm microtubule associated protein 2-like [Lissotriton helveticus]
MQMKHSGDSLVDEILEDIALAERRISPTVTQQKSTRQENMETGDYSQSPEQVPGPEETHKGPPVKHSGDSILASDYPDDIPEAEERPSPKLSKQKSTSSQENEEYGSTNQKEEYRSGSKGSHVHQQMQHSQLSLASPELSDYTDDDDIKRPSTKLFKEKLISHQEDEESGDYIQRRGVKEDVVVDASVPGVAFLQESYSPDEPSNRILQLARPKEDKREWATSFKKLVWGNQDPIWPHSFSALSTTQSKRIISLAKPKKVFQPQPQRLPFQNGWRSATERVPCMDVPSDRILRLAEPKKRFVTPTEQRQNTAALSYKASDRLLQLACPRPVHSDYRAAREEPVRSKASAIQARTPEGAHCLSNPKSRKAALCFPLEKTELPIRPISKMARCAVATPRMEELAKPKHFSTECQPGRSSIWHVSRRTARAIATPRTVELAQPVKRVPMNTAQYNPDAFIVKEAAKKALCSSWNETLSKPISR